MFNVVGHPDGWYRVGFQDLIDPGLAVDGFAADFDKTLQLRRRDGTPVDASNASFPDGTGFALGSVLEVEGQLVNGVLVARKVEREDHDDDDRKNELHGTVSGLNKTTGSFTLRGLTVRYTSSTVFDDGSVATLADGVRIEVKGRLDSDGVTVIATEIDFEN